MTVLILRTTVTQILVSAFVPLTLGDQNVNSVKKITGDSLLNSAARYSRLTEKPWLFKAVCHMLMQGLGSCYKDLKLYSMSQGVSARYSH